MDGYVLVGREVQDSINQHILYKRGTGIYATSSEIRLSHGTNLFKN